ncbi:family 1 glycosylhydrolase [Neorhizobium sp. T786]|uniref:family 1 glycosylhydrolase n=1 Tax=Pseudorhizobium xiangyangii TaxID=2883104 RepID=UPI001CFFABF1|nr:family 1 glycosylhydrolase [Neorhizobium xiangyangii]MCB5203733.1 family 1 glycosylhydrolase [Neorhizobium xiangyangii]
MTPDQDKGPLELWGGVECTIARLGDEYRDQIRETGHDARVGDLDAIASLGIRTIRYPILWETVSPDDPEEADFSWHDRQLARLRELGIEPIVGLLHHGSGPRYTDLLDPAFPDLFARHARRVAERYPHLQHFTPVNEPLTTARFSALYGFWYPHMKDVRAFVRAFINQSKAITSAMRAIRGRLPDAQLVQTEDFGKTFSGPKLKYQADYENERRWLTFDALFGRIVPGHAWYRTFLDHGITPHELDELAEMSCPPQIIGINHYLTSERFLEHDERLWPPEAQIGSNGRHAYVDLEAVRMRLPPDEIGLQARLKEVWHRYRTTIAITEAHHGCTREEQLRWLSEVWEGARRVRIEGCDIKAVTIWSMFGAVDWNSLLQEKSSAYEPGPFDVRGTRPRPTALGAAAKAIVRDGHFDHPVLDIPGWWRRPDRFYHQHASTMASVSRGRRLLVVASGAGGMALQGILQHRGLAYSVLRQSDTRLTNIADIRDLLDEMGAWAFVRLSTGSDERLSFLLGQAMKAHNLRSLAFQLPPGTSDKSSPWAAPNRGEPYSSRFSDLALTIRCPSAFGAGCNHTDISILLRELRQGRRVQLCAHTKAVGAYLPDLFHAGLDLLIDGAAGEWWLANSGDISWLEFGRMLTGKPDVRERGQADTSETDSNRGSLLTNDFSLMPSLLNAAGRYFQELEHHP